MPNSFDVVKKTIKNAEKITVLTGAGVSVASGLGIFRGPGGVWEDEALMKAHHVN